MILNVFVVKMSLYSFNDL